MFFFKEYIPINNKVNGGIRGIILYSMAESAKSIILFETLKLWFGNGLL